MTTEIVASSPGGNAKQYWDILGTQVTRLTGKTGFTGKMGKRAQGRRCLRFLSPCLGDREKMQALWCCWALTSSAPAQVLTAQGICEYICLIQWKAPSFSEAGHLPYSSSTASHVNRVPGTCLYYITSLTVSGNPILIIMDFTHSVSWLCTQAGTRGSLALCEAVRRHIPYQWHCPSSEHRRTRAGRQGQPGSGLARTQPPQ